MSNELTNSPDQPVTAVVQVEQQRAIKEIEAQVILSRRFPRDITLARSKILAECKRPRFADLALYQYPRGKKKNKAGQWVANIIAGPSIRLAEVMARSFTNMKFGIREMTQHDGWSDVQAYAWDMESNVIETRDFTVKHERKSGDSTYKLTDARDIYELVANQGARRMRACILAMIPKDVQDEAEDEVNKTMMNNLAGEAGVDRIKKMLEKFGELDISQVDIEKKFGYKLKSLTLENWAELGRIYNSLKDGVGRAADYFGDEPDGKTDTKATKGVEDDLKAAKDKKDSKEDKTSPPVAQPPTNPEIPSITTEQFAKLKEALDKSGIPDPQSWFKQYWPQIKSFTIDNFNIDLYNVIMLTLAEGLKKKQAEEPEPQDKQEQHDIVSARKVKYIKESFKKTRDFIVNTGGDDFKLFEVMAELDILKPLDSVTVLEYNKILAELKDLKKTWEERPNEDGKDQDQ